MDYLTFRTVRERAMNNASWNKFVFFAFSDKQFEEGVEKVGAKKNRRGKWMLSRLGMSGGFILNTHVKEYLEFWERWDKYEQKFRDAEDYIVNGLVEEYSNHEAQFGMGGRDSAEEIFPQATEEQKKKAWKKFMALCRKNDWF